MSIILLLVATILLTYWMIRRYKWASLINQFPGLEACPLGIMGDTIAVSNFLTLKGTNFGAAENVLRVLEAMKRSIKPE